MYISKKGSAQKNTGPNQPWGKPCLGKTTPPELVKGLDGSLDPGLSCQYYKDTMHDLKYCQSLQCCLVQDCLATQGILAEEEKNASQPWLRSQWQ